MFGSASSGSEDLNKALADTLNTPNPAVDDILSKIKSGANPNTKSSAGKAYRTALGYTSSYGIPAQLDQLLQTDGIDVDVANKSGHTAAHKACWSGRGPKEKLELLCKKSINLDAVGKQGTALQAACASIRTGVEHRQEGVEEAMSLMKVLLFYKAQPNIQDKKGDTVLHTVYRLGQEDVARMLISNGALPDIRNGRGFTPIECKNRISDGSSDDSDSDSDSEYVQV